jgi:hypothetical protein
MAEVHAEIEYLNEDGESVHSDICPPQHDSKGMTDTEWRAFLHANLDEWLDRSNGVGMFWIGDGKRIKEH